MAWPDHTGGLGTAPDVQVTGGDLGHGGRVHMLNHFIDKHEEEENDNEELFWVRIFSYKKALNSKSEYNRCAVPRLATKRGDNIFER